VHPPGEAIILNSVDAARSLDDLERLESRRGLFCAPRDPDGGELAYFLGNSLGLMPRSAPEAIERELDRWASLGVKGHFEGDPSWLEHHRRLRTPMSRLLGAAPEEVVVMNALTVNLHLMLASFYRPTKTRHLILRESPAFPSDCYAVDSHVSLRGFDPGLSVVTVGPRAGETLVRHEDILGAIDEHRDRLALVLFSGLNFATGQRFDVGGITSAAHEAGAMAGFDLAHSAGNTPHELHGWGVDFAVWCTYKYLNSGPGSTGGCFVHEKHWNTGNPLAPKLAGWWGNDPATRFVMAPSFDPAPGAEAWQCSTPAIFSTAPLSASLKIFDDVGMPALRERSLRLTGRLRDAITARCGDRVRIITPADPDAHGAQLSLVIPGLGRGAPGELDRRGVVADFREPNIVRVAPAPLYNTNEDLWRLVEALDAIA